MQAFPVLRIAPDHTHASAAEPLSACWPPAPTNAIAATLNRDRERRQGRKRTSYPCEYSRPRRHSQRCPSAARGRTWRCSGWRNHAGVRPRCSACARACRVFPVESRWATTVLVDAPRGRPGRSTFGGGCCRSCVTPGSLQVTHAWKVAAYLLPAERTYPRAAAWMTIEPRDIDA